MYGCFNIVGVLRGTRDHTEQADDYTFLYENVSANHLQTGFLIHKRIRSSVRRVVFVNDRMSYNVRGHWCNIIVLNLHATI